MKQHTPVLAQEVLTILDPQPGQNFIDCTLGYAGHAKQILDQTAPNGRLLGIDQDEQALAQASASLAAYGNRAQLERANFTKLGLLVRQWPVEHIDGVLIDLGPSTVQLTGERGFSFRGNEFLDMRMDPQSGGPTAADIVNKNSEQEIAQILQLGEERFARPIARKIMAARKLEPIKTAAQLVEVIKTATPPSYRFNRATHFATGTFRALRMAVNHELENLQSVLPQAVQVLSSGGRIAIISFHSLEDRIVKNFLRDQENLEILTPKPIVASDAEIVQNPSARSAKLRGAIKNNQEL